MSKELPHIWQLEGQTDKPKPKRVQVRSELRPVCLVPFRDVTQVSTFYCDFLIFFFSS